jgi:hypothetical protein
VSCDGGGDGTLARFAAADDAVKDLRIMGS